jgi:hypothetical protein
MGLCGGDIARILPFKSDVFDGISALHTIHHVPMDEKAWLMMHFTARAQT